jgi:multidrug transporter EmrE-like cation transporter
VITVLLVLGVVTAHTAAHIFFKRSALGSGARHFVTWQVVGNLVSFGGLVCYTVLLKRMTLHTAYAVTEGLVAVGVLFVGSLLVYRERIRPLAWAGAALVMAGIALFGF